MKINIQDMAVIVTTLASIGTMILYFRDRRVYKRDRFQQKVTGWVMFVVFGAIIILKHFTDYSYPIMISIGMMAVLVVLFIFSYQNYKKLQR
jgi:predicted membrane metal-binding protein